MILCLTRRGLPRHAMPALAVGLTLAVGVPLDRTHAATASAAAGAELYRTCAGCHSLQPGRHRTGPSLAAVLGRKAGGEPGFRRYSDALKSSGLVWDRPTLDAWIAGPQTLVPGNRMTFRGIADPRARRPDRLSGATRAADGDGIAGWNDGHGRR